MIALGSMWPTWISDPFESEAKNQVAASTEGNPLISTPQTQVPKIVFGRSHQHPYTLLMDWPMARPTEGVYPQTKDLTLSLQLYVGAVPPSTKQ